MHILIDCTTTQNEFKNHGVGVYTKHVVKNMLKNKENKYSLLLFDAPSTLDESLKNVGDNVEIVSLGKLRKSDYKNILWYLLKILPKVYKLKTKNSVYFCPYFWAGIPSLHIPTVLMVHDMILPIFNIYSEKSTLHNWLKKKLYWLELSKAKRCKYIVVNTDKTKEDFLKYFPTYDKDKVITVYLGAEFEGSNKDWDKKLPKDYKERGYFIYHGGTPYKNKNSIGVVDGYKKFLERFSSVDKFPYMVIAGGSFVKDNERAEYFRNYIKEQGLEENIILLGFYDDNQIEQLLKNSLSVIHLSAYEGFGIALVEGMMAGVPVIAHDGSCYPEVLGDAGVLVDGYDSEEVGKALFKVYSDGEYREELVKEGLERSKVFSWDKAGKETLDILDDVV